MSTLLLSRDGYDFCVIITFDMIGHNKCNANDAISIVQQKTIDLFEREKREKYPTLDFNFKFKFDIFYRGICTFYQNGKNLFK